MALGDNATPAVAKLPNKRYAPSSALQDAGIPSNRRRSSPTRSYRTFIRPASSQRSHQRLRLGNWWTGACAWNFLPSAAALAALLAATRSGNHPPCSRLPRRRRSGMSCSLQGAGLDTGGLLCGATSGRRRWSGGRQDGVRRKPGGGVRWSGGRESAAVSMAMASLRAAGVSVGDWAVKREQYETKSNW
jgi:hypothetical protein